MKRVFTKIFEEDLVVVEPSEKVVGAVWTWLIQEDIDVIAAAISIQRTTPSENDGFSFGCIELSQVGVYGQDGAILAAQAGEGWNTTPAGICEANGHAVLALPQGYAVPVKEEGYLYVNSKSRGKTAGGSEYHYQVIVYYTKKGSR
ncbi:hypothetical protein ES708_29312 [subsurface metagenome]